MKPRCTAQVCRLPIHELRCGYYSDIYFWREKLTLETHALHPEVTMQVFQKKEALLCGIEEALAVLEAASGHYRDPRRAAALFEQYLKTTSRDSIARELDELWVDGFAALGIQSLRDGDPITPWESVMHIRGDASLFAHLETVYLGILARRTRIATNVRSAADAANGKPLLFFPARFDHWAVQEGDGYAAFIGGAFGVSTPAQAAWMEAEALGTVPHALIAATGGDTARAVALFGESFPGVNLVALVDFDNDCIGTALTCCKALGDRMWGVRLDTATELTDISASAPGVTAELVEQTRRQLDANGFDHVKIIASGGFDSERIRRFEALKTPVDAYGVGSALMRDTYDFTADVVLLNGQPCAKAGRQFRPNPRMKSIS